MKVPAFGLVLGLLLASSSEAGSIRLRTSATIEAGSPVRLGDVAILEGDDAVALGGVLVVGEPSKRSLGRCWMSVSIAEVQRAVREAGGRMSTLTVSGSECAVRIETPAPVTETKAANTPKRAPQAEVVEQGGPPTVRKQAAAALAALLGVDGSDLRILFDAEDAAFLDQPRIGVEVIVQPRTTAMSSRSVLACRIVDGDRLLESRTIRADAQVQRKVVVLQESVKRKGEIPVASLQEQEMWISSSAARPIGSIEEAAGSLARTRLETGTVLFAEHLETPVVIRRNELVSILTIGGGFEVQTRARARSDARRGDVIAFRPEGSKKEFTARAERAGLAVMNLDGVAGGGDEDR
ncbi:MAG: flagellar basal body P-ring formation protein FlgA [Phycisphaerae bacterium]|nr:flagellar basal body P-ring formation protein FlgA [Phycisphaerae bacterium]